MIQLGSPQFGASDGQFSTIEAAAAKITDIPTPMKMLSDSGWVLVDGFNQPFQYTKGPDRPRPGDPPTPPTTMNVTYDLWSYAESKDNTTAVDLGSKQNIKISGRWIKNW
jgi:hypothetical protein